MTVYGVDISSWQQGLDLSRVAKEGYPAVMVKVMIYGYATGVFSSRKLARKVRRKSS